MSTPGVEKCLGLSVKYNNIGIATILLPYNINTNCRNMDGWLLEMNEHQREIIEKQYLNAKSYSAKIKILFDNHPKGRVSPEPIKHLDDYFKCIRLTTTDSSWFRGQSKEFKSLIPKIYRNANTEDIRKILSKERQFFLEFRRRAKSVITSIPDGDFWSWYFLIQHYGGLTRLLDWTSNAGVALFMALDSDRDSKDNPIVYILSPTVLKNYAYNDLGMASEVASSVLYPGESITNTWITNITEENFDLPNSPIALLPAYSDARIIAQKSCFTLFGKQIDGFVKDNKEILCPCCDGKIIHRIIIDGDNKEMLRKELSKIGITSETVYPGLEGINKNLCQEIYGR